MARLRLAPTRSSLISVRQRLKLAQQGYELLNSKRDVLVIEILRMIKDAEGVERQVREQFAKAYVAMQETRAVMGTHRVYRHTLSRVDTSDVRITPRSIMGVVVPSVHYEAPAQRPRYGFGDTSVMRDKAQVEWAAALALMGRLAESVTTVWRLALELRRTQRRVRALESVFIPSYQETLAYIEDTLEEKEREELFRTKLAKAKLEARREVEF